ncbi:unnamed protein product [Closterium sp. Naga37s-1]|nr:unnamed protein product [Closterium sp. Naga37s-1]
MPNAPNQAPVPPSLLPATPSPTRVSLQLTEEWGERLFVALARAGGRAYNNMAVGYNNIDVDAATKHSISVGNTPVSGPSGMLTETTAELAASLTLAAARCVVEADYFMRAGKYDGWLPTMFISNLLKGRHRHGAHWQRLCTHDDPFHRLSHFPLYLSPLLKDAILVNCSRGPVVDEVALVRHLKANPAFRAALGVECRPPSTQCVAPPALHPMPISPRPSPHTLPDGARQCIPLGPYVESHPIICSNTDPTLLYASRHQEETLMKQYLYTLLNVVIMPQPTRLDPPLPIPSLCPLPLPASGRGRATDEAGPLQAAQHGGRAAHRLRLAVDARRHGCLAALNVAGKLQRHHVWHNTNGVPILLVQHPPSPPSPLRSPPGEATGLPRVAQPQRRAALPRPHQPTPQGVPQHRQRHAARRVFAAWRLPGLPTITPSKL